MTKPATEIIVVSASSCAINIMNKINTIMRASNPRMPESIANPKRPVIPKTKPNTSNIRTTRIPIVNKKNDLLSLKFIISPSNYKSF